MANLLVAFAGLFMPELVDRLAFSPISPTFLGVVGSMFGHTVLLHLLANMIFLAAVGPLVEFSRGGWRLIVIYAVGGIAGVAAHGLVSQITGTDVAILGASSSVAACVGFCAIRYMSVKVPIFPKVAVSVGGVAVIWVVIQALGAVVRIGELNQAGSAFWAHLAGFFAGLIAAIAFGGLKQARMEFGHEVLDRMNLRGPAAILAAAEEHLKEHPGDLRGLRERAQALEDLNDVKEAAQAYQDLMDASPLESKGEYVRKIAALGGLSSLPVVSRMRLADSLAAVDPEASVIVLESIVLGADDPRVPDALVSLAELAKESAPKLAQDCIDRLVSDFPMHPAMEIARQKGLVQ
ncbi:rhomboid family intramembrane serine protease [Kamptonema cortianum]|nr:rhomboid family intramembrane serine protease [Geitlerinema splendidum]MDK3156846.1 rhomboid family intramembrane serine protease [Kamptonema cortianum]